MIKYASRDQVITPDGPGVVVHKEMKANRGRWEWSGRYWVRLNRESETGLRQGHYRWQDLTRNT